MMVLKVETGFPMEIVVFPFENIFSSGIDGCSYVGGGGCVVPMEMMLLLLYRGLNRNAYMLIRQLGYVQGARRDETNGKGNSQD